MKYAACFECELCKSNRVLLFWKRIALLKNTEWNLGIDDLDKAYSRTMILTQCPGIDVPPERINRLQPVRKRNLHCGFRSRLARPRFKTCQMTGQSYCSVLSLFEAGMTRWWNELRISCLHPLSDFVILWHLIHPANHLPVFTLTTEYGVTHQVLYVCEMSY